MKKIRVLHCVTAMNRGGLETLIMNYYRNIDREKFDFDFLVQRSEIGDYEPEIEKMGGRIYRVSSFNPFNIKKYVNDIDDFFKHHANDYDIVHAHNNSFAMYVLRAAKKYGIKVRISHSHIAKNVLNYKFPFIMYNKLNLKKYCTVQFACGEEAGKFLFNNEKSYIVKNAVDLDKFLFNELARNQIRESYCIDDDILLLGHVGRFDMQKNHEFLIRIMEIFKKQNEKVKLMLIGSGKLQENIKKLVEELELSDYVIFVGNVGNVNDYLNAMDVFVMPSLFEGLPVTLIEAQANGLHCYVSDNVPAECKVTSLIDFLSLSLGAGDWSKTIIDNSPYERKNEMDKIIESGFEIKSATKQLEMKYMDLLSK